MDKLLDKEVHQLFKASPNDAEMSNYVLSTVPSSAKHDTVAESATSVEVSDEMVMDKTGDEGLGADCQEEPKAADDVACLPGKPKSKSSTLLG